MKLLDIKDRLPISDHCFFVVDTFQDKDLEFYSVLGRKFQLTNDLEYVLPILNKIYKSYGERAMLAKKNEGVDWKAMSHSLRTGYQLRDIFKENNFKYPLTQTGFLLDVKLGKLDYKTEVSVALEGLIDEINELILVSSLPSKTNQKYWNNWLVDVYKKALL